MNNRYLKILILLSFFVLSFGILAEDQEEIMRVTRQELKELKINDKSIEKTFEGIKMQGIDFSKSKKPFEEAVQLDNKNYLAMFYIGTYERAFNKDAKKAIEYYQKAINLNPKNPRPYNNLAIAYGYLGDTKKSDETIKQIMSLFPEYPEGYYLWALKLLDNKKYSESTEYMKKAIEKYNKIKKIDYWYITQDMKKSFIVDAQKIIINNYVKQEKLAEAIEFFEDSYINMKQDNSSVVNELMELLYYKNQELYENKNSKLYKENFDKLKSIEFLGLLMEANDHLKGKNKGK